MTYGEKLVHLVDATFEHKAKDDGQRHHLGASIVGNNCARQVWFAWRWVESEVFDGRMLRLFAHGHEEENRFANLLRGVGATVWTEDPVTKKQFRVSTLGGHFGGSMDAVIMNLPDFEPMPVLGEFKTHNDKSFKELLKKGVKESKPHHYKQAQIYMHLAPGGVHACLYCAVNKNDESLRFEMFQYDSQVGTMLVNRAESIIFGHGLPHRISENSSWFECKWCAMRGVCFRWQQPRRNCRTCKYSKPERDGTWSCGLGQPEIQTEPKVGCTNYDVIPELAPF